MQETPEDLTQLQGILDESDASGGHHLRGIISAERRLSAEQLAGRLTGMRLLVVATSTRDGRPLVSPVDGIFYRARFWFGSAPSALKMRHIAERPAASATHVDGEAFAVTVHGTAAIEGTVDDLKDSGFGEVAREIYGDGWLTWGAGAVYAALTPERMYTFHME
ncbi:MAG: pyridoxamine 5'-phosphate oxidase family protein [Acidimicrobiia bacterium]|nr:pyridoxamine 5'-phosphate oxidase family protein [Acidimicrobiia bacterium]